MSEALTSSETPGVAELMGLGWNSATAYLKSKQAMAHTKLNILFLCLYFKCIFSSSNYKNLSMDNA